MASAVPLGRIEPPVARVLVLFWCVALTMLSEQIAEAATTCGYAFASVAWESKHNPVSSGSTQNRLVCRGFLRVWSDWPSWNILTKPEGTHLS